MSLEHVAGGLMFPEGPLWRDGRLLFSDFHALRVQAVEPDGTVTTVCEVAAHRRTAISRLVLLDPIGLWRDDAPVAQYMTMTPDELPGVLFHDPAGPAAQAALAMPESTDELAVAMADAVWAMGATGKFVWPIPDKGLARRLHRVTAPALVVWGEHDRLVSPVYAEEFAARLADARVEIVPDAGHVPQVERLDVVAPLVLDFLAA